MAAVRRAADLGRADLVKELVWTIRDFNEVKEGRTVLMLAAKKGHADVVAVLLKAGGDMIKTKIPEGLFSDAPS
ncbi:hypothetical protein GPECTOR_37g149 [Gonium pectorale]|uniref:Uncharacterized protein n=1 Tax=Gonium pectorale TaxID=33097 RepID=A0A150GBD8_GONPE|nr:hypothetical protein GPECTOR_37g149 [Gonium pectorale]|eukprot:KXZ47144.1 hypothetical protein GPECTOR_37g149 [Gonium pectorale]